MAMRLLLILVVLAGTSLWAAPCVMGPLSGYLGVGFTCTAGGVDFDLWSYAPGATGVSADDVLVVPSVAGPVLEFNALDPMWTRLAGGLTSGSIGFRGTGAIVGTRLYLGGSGVAGGAGSVTLVTAICLNSTLPACALGSTLPSISSYRVAGSPGVEVILSESFYPLEASVDIKTTFTIDGGDSGASLWAFQSGFYAPVPEPSAFALTVSGLAVVVAAAARRRRFGRRSLFSV